MRAKYKVRRGTAFGIDLHGVAGVIGQWPNPFGEGADILELELEGCDPDTIPVRVKDQTTGQVILERVL